MKRRNLVQWLALLFLGSASTYLVSAAEFEKLLEDYNKKKNDCKKKNGETKQKYVENAKKIAVDESSKLDDVKDDSFKCHRELRDKLNSGSIKVSDFEEKDAKCTDDFVKKTEETAVKSREDIGKKQQDTKTDITKMDADLYAELVEVRGATAGKLGSDEVQTLKQLEQEQEQAKRENARTLRKLDLLFNDTICIDIDNVRRELTESEVKFLSSVLLAFLSKDLFDLGLDYYSKDITFVNQTLFDVADDLDQQSRRGLRDYRRRRMGSRKRLLTEWGSALGCYRCLSSLSCDSTSCRYLDEEEEDRRNPFHRSLQQYVNIDQFPTVELMVQHIFETRLKEMKAVWTDETTVEAKPCGVWPLTEPVVTVNPDQFEDLEEFKEAHGKIAVKEQDETRQYEEQVDTDYVKHQEDVGKEEEKYIRCTNEVNEKFMQKKIDAHERKLLYITCFEEFDQRDNNTRRGFVQNISKRKEKLRKKMGDLDTKITGMIKKLDLEVLQKDTTTLAEDRGAVAEERDAEERTRGEIAREQSKLSVRFSEGLTCRIDNMKRSLTNDELSILSDIIQRGANYAFNRCNIDLHMANALVVDQTFDGRRMQHMDSEQRRLGSIVNVRLDSDCECVRCTQCDEDETSGTCTCCLKRRKLTGEAYRLASVDECFNRYISTRVKKLVEARLKTVIYDSEADVYAECSII